MSSSNLARVRTNESSNEITITSGPYESQKPYAGKATRALNTSNINVKSHDTLNEDSLVSHEINHHSSEEALLLANSNFSSS